MQNAMIAELATEYMDTDKVTAAQAGTYLALHTEINDLLEDSGVVNAHSVAAGLDRPTREAITALLRDAQAPKSHVWVKGAVAVWLTTQR